MVAASSVAEGVVGLMVAASSVVAATSMAREGSACFDLGG